MSGSLEAQRYFSKPPVVHLGVAAFVDGARVSHRLSSAIGDPVQVDAGAGFRLRFPGRDMTLRIDYARGLRDAANAVTVGFGVF